MRMHPVFSTLSVLISGGHQTHTEKNQAATVGPRFRSTDHCRPPCKRSVTGSRRPSTVLSNQSPNNVGSIITSTIEQGGSRNRGFRDAIIVADVIIISLPCYSINWRPYIKKHNLTLSTEQAFFGPILYLCPCLTTESHPVIKTRQRSLLR